jgi:hypothetical protein
VGKPKDPDYWRKWRARNPEYRERERLRAQKRRRDGKRGDRSGEYRRRSARLRAQREAEAPSALATHPLINCAKCMVSSVMKQDRRTYVYDDLFDEAVSEVLLAWTLGEDPKEGIERVRKASTAWKARNITGVDYDVTDLQNRLKR